MLWCTFPFCFFSIFSSARSSLSAVKSRLIFSGRITPVRRYSHTSRLVRTSFFASSTRFPFGWMSTTLAVTMLLMPSLAWIWPDELSRLCRFASIVGEFAAAFSMRPSFRRMNSFSSALICEMRLRLNRLSTNTSFLSSTVTVIRSCTRIGRGRGFSIRIHE